MLSTGRPEALASRNTMCAMARSHSARQRQRQASAGGITGRSTTLACRAPRLNRFWRASFVAAIAGLCAALPLLTGMAAAQPDQQSSGGPLALSVLSVSPSYAQHGQTVTITGQIRNLSATNATGVSVKVKSSRTQFGSRGALETFANPAMDGYGYAP